MSYVPSLTMLTLSSFNGKTTGPVKVGTTANGTQSFYPLILVTAITSASAIITPMTLSLGTNASSYNNLIAATLMTGLTSLSQMLQTGVTGAVGKVAPGTDVYINVTSGATATTATAEAHLIGYYM